MQSITSRVHSQARYTQVHYKDCIQLKKQNFTWLVILDLYGTGIYFLEYKKYIIF